jgi:hypothetical protein
MPLQARLPNQPGGGRGSWARVGSAGSNVAPPLFLIRTAPHFVQTLVDALEKAPAPNGDKNQRRLKVQRDQ